MTTTSNPNSGMTLTEMKSLIRSHFDQLINQKILATLEKNLSPDFIDHGADVPPGTLPGPAGAQQYVGAAIQHFPDIHVEILDLIAEDDKVVVRNRWTATDPASRTRIEFSGIVIWRFASKKSLSAGLIWKNPIP